MLAVSDLSLPADGPFGVTLRSVSLDVRGGEIVAIAGVAGNGQSELFEVLSGERLATAPDAIGISGAACGHDGVTARRRLGAAFVPEERLGHSAIPSFVLADNVLLTRHTSDREMVNRGFVDQSRTLTVAERVNGRFDVRTSRDNPEASALSGGNLQKFVVGRELDRDPRVVVINQPTWGVDAGAAALIRQALVDMARAGAAVLVISQDLDEIFEIADRVAVISRGELSEAFPARAIDRERGRPAHGRRPRDRRPGTAGGNAGMRLMLERRPEQSRTMTVASPLIAIAVTVVAGGIVFYARGLDPFHALYVYFVEPVMSVWSLESWSSRPPRSSSSGWASRCASGRTCGTSARKASSSRARSRARRSRSSCPSGSLRWRWC